MCQVALVGSIKFIRLNYKKIKSKWILKKMKNTFETNWKICVQTYFLVRKLNEIDV